jgi:hypothetical protein
MSRLFAVAKNHQLRTLAFSHKPQIYRDSHNTTNTIPVRVQGPNYCLSFGYLCDD